MKVFVKCATVACLLLVACSVHAADIKPAVEIVPNHTDWNYDIGDNVCFDIILKNCPDTEVSYSVGLVNMPATMSAKILTHGGRATVEGGTMVEPGFLSCSTSVRIGGIEYHAYTAVAFNPEKIKPTTTMPDDFTDFWANAINEARQIPLEPRLALIPERSTSEYNMYHIRMNNMRKGCYVYGLLCVPTSSGPHPAVLKVPGAGVKLDPPDTVLAKRGFITLLIGVNGIPYYGMPREVYGALANGALHDYWFLNLDDKNNYYYKRVFLGCVRAVDYIFSMKEFDGRNIGVSGGSQGGGLAIVTAGLDPRIKALVSFYPALCDHTGYLNGRAGGWPGMFSPANAKVNATPQKIETSRYYDAVNFARLITAPGYYSFGYNDRTCPPTSTFSAYNAVTAPKKLLIVKETGHFRTPYQQQVTEDWLVEQLSPKR